MKKFNYIVEVEFNNEINNKDIKNIFIQSLEKKSFGIDNYVDGKIKKVYEKRKK